MSTVTSTSLVKISQLDTQYPKGLLGVSGQNPILAWQVSANQGGLTQLAYEIQASGTADFAAITAETGEVVSEEQVGVVAPGGALTSREVRYFRVRIKTQAGWSDWSASASVEAGLLNANDFSAKAIGDDSKYSSPAPAVRKEISLKSHPSKARLYISAHGLYEAYINGDRVGQDYLNPGWTAYDDRVMVHTYDVAKYLQAGTNTISSLIGDGWYRGHVGFMGNYENYGTKIKLVAQLEVSYQDGSSEIFATDGSWKVSNVEQRFDSIYDGSVIDYNFAQPGWQQNGFDDSSWSAVVVHEFDNKVLKPAITEPVRQVGHFPLKLEKQADRTLLRGVQNISGWVELTVDGKKGQTVVVRHAEVLEPGDKLHTKALRSAKATDTYVLARDGRHVLTPKFTFHGFQHADVVTDAEIVSAEAIAVSSLQRRRGHFISSNTRLNRLHTNVLWSQLDNFVSLPTDCPQRDERLGWTGDAQAFAGASNTLFDTESFWRNWLIDLELDQFENGDVGAVVPDILKRHQSIGDWVIEGRAGWADAASIVPMTSLTHFGDKSVVAQQLNSMRRWVMALHNRRKGEKFLPTEFQFGDWCDPDAPGDRPWESKVSADLVANAFFANSVNLQIQAEQLVGDKEHEQKFQEMFDTLKKDFWEHFGAEVKTTTAGAAIAIEFGLVPAGELAATAKHLSDMVLKDQGMITTGFLGTPLILHALSKNGHLEAAYAMLLRTDFRSWLYAVDRGATTMWERWDAIRHDGTIHTGAMDTNPEGQDDASMISFNHYAYGAVVDWMYRNVAGISGDHGFRKITVQPTIAQGMTYAKGMVESRYGTAAVEWQLQDSGVLEVIVTVPFGVTAELVLPKSATSSVLVNGVASEKPLGYGIHRVLVTNPSIVSK